MMTTETLTAVPMFAVDARVQIARATQCGPSQRRVDPAVYTVVSSSYGPCGFTYRLQDVATGEPRRYFDHISNLWQEGEVYENWLRRAR